MTHREGPSPLGERGVQTRWFNTTSRLGTMLRVQSSDPTALDEPAA
jgi:hypothetical protein